MGVLLPFQPPGLQLGAHDAQRADARVAHVGEDHLAGAARRHHLIVDQVGGGARQGQVSSALADDLVPGGEGDQVGETGGVDHVAIVHILPHRRGEGDEFGHREG